MDDENFTRPTSDDNVAALRAIAQPPTQCDRCGARADVFLLRVRRFTDGKTRLGAFSEFGYMQRSRNATLLLLREGYAFERWFARCCACHRDACETVAQRQCDRWLAERVPMLALEAPNDPREIARWRRYHLAVAKTLALHIGQSCSRDELIALVNAAIDRVDAELEGELRQSERA